MTRGCARSECSETATARFFFDARAKLLIIDPLIDEWGGSGVLCAAHADRMTPPRGWSVDDRRIVEPRLFNVGRFDAAPGPAPSEDARRSRARRLTMPEAHPSTPLPLDGGPTYELPDGYVAVEAPGVRATSAADVPVPGSQTPLLARAFEAARSRVRPDSSLDSLIRSGSATA